MANSKKLPVVLFYPELARRLDSIPAALLYQHLYFWSDKGSRPDGFIYKTKDVIKLETALTRDKQDRACDKLEAEGVIKIRNMRANGHGTLHYKILVSPLEFMSRKPAAAPAGNLPLQTQETSEVLTDSTTESTTDSKIVSSSSIKKKTNKTETYLKNEVCLNKAVEAGEFQNAKYDFPTNGAYDWRALINHGQGLTPERFILARYWRVKTEGEAWKANFSFATKDMMLAAIDEDIRNAMKMASTVSFADFERLMDIADVETYDDKKDEYWMEWKLSTLFKYIPLLVEKEQKSLY
jgi:hypothetical protein